RFIRQHSLLIFRPLRQIARRFPTDHFLLITRHCAAGALHLSQSRQPHRPVHLVLKHILPSLTTRHHAWPP
ncbi:MAG: hypothetical protein ABJO14_02125, partial [Haloferula sp.]|uniref:hypothetical protein n=1 Tax=Haloferula sp. TaxID=2497595 RepID=UPI00329E1A11